MIDRLFPKYRTQVIALCVLCWLVPSVCMMGWGKGSVLIHAILSIVSIVLIPVGYGLGLVLFEFEARLGFAATTLDQIYKYFFYLGGAAGIVFNLGYPMIMASSSTPTDYGVNGGMAAFGIAWAAYNCRRKHSLRRPAQIVDVEQS